MAAHRVAWVAVFSLLGLVGVSLAESSPERCGGAEGSAEEDDEAVCALQHGSLKKDAAMSSKQPSVSSAQVEVKLHEHKEAASAKASVAHEHKETEKKTAHKAKKATHKAKKAKKVKKGQQSDEAGVHYPWSDDSEEEEEAVADAEARGFGVDDAEILNYAEDYLDDLPSKDAFDDQVGWSGLPLTMAFVNDMSEYLVWDSLEELDGHIFDEPEPGTRIRPGEIVTVQMYAMSDGLKARARLHDPQDQWLSIAWQSYRMGSLSCDRLRVMAMRTYQWDNPTDVMCNTDAAGIFRRNDYEVIVSLKRAGEE